jgi:UDP-N-acetylmuramate dehydrogenase
MVYTTVETNYDLTPLNTLHISASAARFSDVRDLQQLQNLIRQDLFSDGYLLLGKGANILFRENFPHLVVKISTQGFQVVSQTNSDIILEIAAGHDWCQLVETAVNSGWAGIENMALIPGTVGAAPIGNIAAYGQNFTDVFDSLDAVNLHTGKVEKFTAADCKFGYRDSIFKHELKHQYAVTAVRLKLSKVAHLETSYHSRYESLESELSTFAKPPYSIKDIHQAVINIRTRKLPDWTKVGTAGSFFKNPVIPNNKLVQLQNKFPNIQYYPVDKLSYPQPNDPGFVHADHVKIAAGWILDELGWKGKKIGHVGTAPNQALVVINEGGTGQEVYEFTESMRADFKKHTDVELEYEVVII